MKFRNRSLFLSAGRHRLIGHALRISIASCILFLPACKKAVSTPTDIAASCRTCEAARCTVMFAGDAKAWGCAGLPGPDKLACEAFVKCVRDSQCARTTRDPQACFCGSAQDVPCLSGEANGACKAQAEAAAKTSDPTEVATRFSDPTSPIRSAVNQIACDLAQCANECQM